LQLPDKQPLLAVIPHNLARGSKSVPKKAAKFGRIFSYASTMRLCGGGEQ
jgi:hypothetical protein